MSALVVAAVAAVSLSLARSLVVSALATSQQQAPAPAGKEHAEIPDTEAATCAACHEEIAKGAVVHAPVSEGLCTGCHEFSGSGDATRVRLAGGAASDNTAPLCTTCHDAVAEALKFPNVHAAAATGDCTSCHEPHRSERRALLKSPQGELCGTCHDGVASDLKKKSVHAPAASRCTSCHDPHGSLNPRLLREVPNALCQVCHALPPVAPGAKPVESITIVKGVTVERAALPLAKQVALDRSGRGHPIVDHPTSGASDPLKKDRPFTCMSCHAAHGSDTPHMLAFELQPGEGICQKCHEM